MIKKQKKKQLVIDNENLMVIKKLMTQRKADWRESIEANVKKSTLLRTQVERKWCAQSA